MRRQVITVVSGFVAFLAGLYVSFGVGAALLAGGAVVFVAGLLWEEAK